MRDLVDKLQGNPYEYPAEEEVSTSDAPEVVQEPPVV